MRARAVPAIQVPPSPPFSPLQVTVQARWQAHRAAAALEAATMWLPTRALPLSPAPQPTLPPTGAGADAEAAAGVAAAGGPEAAGGSRSKRRRKHSQGEPQAEGGGAGDAHAQGDGGSPQQQHQQQQPPGLALPEPASFVRVCGMDLPRRISSASISGSGSSSGGAPPAHDDHAFVSTPTVARNLRAAALALCAERPLLLEGPPGCGKTRLVQQLADLTCNADSMVGATLTPYWVGQPRRPLAAMGSKHGFCSSNCRLAREASPPGGFGCGGPPWRCRVQAQELCRGASRQWEHGPRLDLWPGRIC